MKQFKILRLILCFMLISILSSCKTPTTHSEGRDAINNAEMRITDSELNIAKNNQVKLVQIGEYSFATGFALDSLRNSPNFSSYDDFFKSTIAAAGETNDLVQSLAPSPSAEKMKEMQRLIDNLTSELTVERKLGEASLAQYQSDIKIVNDKAATLETEKKEAIENHKIVARTLGEKVDTLAGQVDEKTRENDGLKDNLKKYDEGFGFYAIWHGIKVFFNKIMWIGIGFTVVFLVLKLLSASNPIAGSIFSVFESMIGAVFKGVASIFPKVWKFAGVVSKVDFDLVKNTRNKIIDGLEELYRIEEKTPGKKFTLDEVFEQFSKDMGDEEKAEVSRTLKELGWKN